VKISPLSVCYEMFVTSCSLFTCKTLHYQSRNWQTDTRSTEFAYTHTKNFFRYCV